MEEEIYIAVPPGYLKKLPKRVVLLLEKGLYSLKQLARKWNKKFKEAIRRLGFVPIIAS